VGTVEKSILDCVAPRFWETHVDGYTSLPKIGSRLATMVFEQFPSHIDLSFKKKAVEKSILDCVAPRF
jgi:hypothetical protein